MVSNFIPFEGMEFDATVSLLPCWGWRGGKSTRLVMGFSLTFEIFWQRPTGSSSIAGVSTFASILYRCLVLWNVELFLMFVARQKRSSLAKMPTASRFFPRGWFDESVTHINKRHACSCKAQIVKIWAGKIPTNPKLKLSAWAMRAACMASGFLLAQ